MLIIPRLLLDRFYSVVEDPSRFLDDWSRRYWTLHFVDKIDKFIKLLNNTSWTITGIGAKYPTNARPSPQTKHRQNTKPSGQASNSVESSLETAVHPFPYPQRKYYI
jgi:hypothetical protein